MKLVALLGLSIWSAATLGQVIDADLNASWVAGDVRQGFVIEREIDLMMWEHLTTVAPRRFWMYRRATSHSQATQQLMRWLSLDPQVLDQRAVKDGIEVRRIDGAVVVIDLGADSVAGMRPEFEEKP